MQAFHNGAGTRQRHGRARLRHDTALTDTERAVIPPLTLGPAPCGRPPVWTRREILNTISREPRGCDAGKMVEGCKTGAEVPLACRAVRPRPVRYERKLLVEWRFDVMLGRIARCSVGVAISQRWLCWLCPAATSGFTPGISVRG